MGLRHLAVFVSLTGLGVNACAVVAGLDAYGPGSEGAGGDRGTGGQGGTPSGAVGQGGAEDISLTASVDWMRRFTGSGAVFGTGIAVAPGGDVGLCAHFEGALDVEGEPYASNDFDGLVTRVDADGAARFTTLIQGGGHQYCGGVVVEGVETIVAGTTESEVIVAGAPTQSAAVAGTIFVVRLNDDGTSIGQPILFGNTDGFDFVNDVSEALDGIVLGGSYDKHLGMGGQIINQSGVEQDAYVARFLSGSDWLFAIDDDPAVGDAKQTVLGVAASLSTGRVVSVGETRGELALAPQRDPGTERAGFITSVASGGDHQWTVVGLGTANTYLRGVAIHSVDEMGNVVADRVVVAGTFSGALSLGGMTAQGTSSMEAFVAMLADDGSAQWIRPLTGPGDQEAWDVAIDEDGTIIVVGETTGAIDFGEGELEVAQPSGFVWALSLDGESRFGGLVTASDFASVRLVAAHNPGVVYIGTAARGAQIDVLGTKRVLGDGSNDFVLSRLILGPSGG